MSRILIHIEPAAPSKPAAGDPCNGCGVCCLTEPCPLGRVLSGRRTGACAALRWGDGRYRCGALSSPQALLEWRLPRGLHGLVPALARLLARLAGRWIAAGRGCDCSLEVERVP
jgi:hypothetical protein